MSETSDWQFAYLPSSQQYCDATPTESVPFLGGRVVDHQHDIVAAEQSIRLLGKHPLQRRVVHFALLTR